ncbi:6-carboxytetrahydropterin synthase [Candidatus Cyanaurora vandensis]|uniref:6-carboxytetrahydropterin synthase n=1 Tax=Candidatus Cyanaurora vandensis TaxID=2714958 RepID=UPI00257EB48A|nr:6-carboxytetrahydropterin synthase [Candidatus Cyanaurora vandensis]
MYCTIVRRAKFNASHRYWLEECTPPQNQARFGPTVGVHGHDYVLFVTMAGPVDGYGMVLNLSEVKHQIRDLVTAPLNYQHLNTVWPEFAHTLPTTEYLAAVIWARLKPHLPITQIQIYETDTLWAAYQGEAMTAYLTVSTHFSAAHRLALDTLTLAENTEIYGLCARVHGHGHNYGLEVTVAGEIDPRTGMIVDLAHLQQAIERHVVKPFDHTFLNHDLPYFQTVVPTAENIALHIAQLLQTPIQELGARLHKIKLIESPNNAAEVLVTAPVPNLVALLTAHG